jgi:hypothetical protein
MMEFKRFRQFIESRQFKTRATDRHIEDPTLDWRETSSEQNLSDFGH